MRRKKLRKDRNNNSPKVRFLNKTGIFCELCAEEILDGRSCSRVEDANEAARIGQ